MTLDLTHQIRRTRLDDPTKNLSCYVDGYRPVLRRPNATGEVPAPTPVAEVITRNVPAAAVAHSTAYAGRQHAKTAQSGGRHRAVQLSLWQRILRAGGAR